MAGHNSPSARLYCELSHGTPCLQCCSLQWLLLVLQTSFDNLYVSFLIKEFSGFFTPWPSAQSSFSIYSSSITCSPIVSLKQPGPRATQLLAAGLPWQHLSNLAPYFPYKLRSPAEMPKLRNLGVNLAFKVIAEYLITIHIKFLKF